MSTQEYSNKDSCENAATAFIQEFDKKIKNDFRVHVVYSCSPKLKF
jgi:hypothetical protein